MTEPMITCPNCRTHIPLTESLAAPLIAATRKKYEKAMAQKDRDMAQRESALRERQEALEKDRAAIEATVVERLAAERKRIR